MTLSITLPASITVTTRGVSVDVSIASLSADLVAKLALHGLVQKISDAAAGALRVALPKSMEESTLAEAKAWGKENAATVDETAKGLMQKAVDAIIAGTWSTRAVGSGVSKADELTVIMRDIMRAQVKANPKALVRYVAIDKKDVVKRLAFIDDLITRNLERMTIAAQKVIDARAIESDGLDF